MPPERPSSFTARRSSPAHAAGSCTGKSATALSRGLTLMNSSWSMVLYALQRATAHSLSRRKLMKSPSVG